MGEGNVAWSQKAGGSVGALEMLLMPLGESDHKKTLGIRQLSHRNRHLAMLHQATCKPQREPARVGFTQSYGD